MIAGTVLKKILRILGIALIAILLVVFIRGCQGFRRMSPYLSAEMVVMPKLEYDDNDISSMKEKYLILTNPENNRGEVVLLSSMDLNLILREKGELGSRANLSVEDDLIRLIYSLPIPFSGKFINGSMLFSLGLNGSSIGVDILEISANDISLDNDSKDLIEEIVAKYSEAEKNLSEYLIYLDRIDVEDGNVSIKLSE